MKISMLLLGVLTLASTASYAQLGSKVPNANQPPPKLEQLDAMKTCVTQGQKETAINGLSFLNDFRWWHVNNMYNAVHKDLKIWHSSWAHTFNSNVLTAEQKARLPMQKGQSNKEALIATLTYIAFTNDVGSYEILPTRLDCVNDNTAIISTVFFGTSVVRDAQGYVRYVEKIEVPTRVIVSTKDGLISGLYFDLKDDTGDEVFKKLFARVAKGQPDVTENDPNRRGTFAEIFECFNYDIGKATKCSLKQN